MPVPPTNQPTPAAILLCGGRSSRMGQSKALLDWQGQSLIERVVAKIAAVAHPILVVASRGQPLPPLEGAVTVFDELAFPGPVAAFQAGLRGLPDSSEFCLLLSCDLPLFEPRLAGLLLQAIGKADFAMPRISETPQPLCALYRVKATLKALETMSATGASMGQLRQRLEGVFLDERDCAAVDPALGSFQPCNTPEEFARLLDAEKK